MEDTIKIELLTPLTGTFIPNEMEQDWEEEDYNDFEEEQVFFEGDDLTEYASVIQEKIAEYNRVGHDDDKTDNLMDYFDGSVAIKEKVVSAVPSVKESDGVLYGCTTLELKEYLETEELSELCEYLTGQYSDGWGEGFEQQEIQVDGGELHVHFWQPRDYLFEQVKPEIQNKQEPEKKKPKMEVLGRDGNVFIILGAVAGLLIKEGMDQQANEMYKRVMQSGNYYQALHIISEYVETELMMPMENTLQLGNLLKEGTYPEEYTGGEKWTILHGDTLKLVKAFQPGIFDAVITDPPYASGGTKQNERNRTTNQKYSSMKAENALPDFDGDNKDQRSWTHWMTEWLYDVRKACKVGAPICLFIDWRQYPSITDALQWAGWIWRGTAVWDKGNSRPQKGRFRQQAEYIVWGSNGPMPISRPVSCLPGVFRYGNTQNRIHVTEKPLQLMKDVIQICEPGGRILDPFAGAGTTVLAAVEEGYEAVGIEVTDAYYKLGSDRVKFALEAKEKEESEK